MVDAGVPMKLTLDSLFLEQARRQSLNRRQFLLEATGAGAACMLMSARSAHALVQKPAAKTIVITFGGGARDQETFAPEGQRFIPRILAELIPRSTFYTQVINRGILGHYVATAGLASGCYETFNNFQPVRPANPTLFEYYRHDLRRPASDAWVIAPSTGFNHIGESSHRLYGAGMGATVVLPKRLLQQNSNNVSAMTGLMRDSYEAPLAGPDQGLPEADAEKISKLLRISLTDFQAHGRTVSSPDELSYFLALHLMRTQAPSLLWITLHDIDIAHAGAFSLYTDAIERTDRLCADIVKEIDTNAEYKGRTNVFILPDFGRDGDSDPGGNGFQHHRTGDALSRTTWLMAMGPNIRQNVTVDRPVESVDLVPTLSKLLGCNARFAAGSPLVELL